MLKLGQVLKVDKMKGYLKHNSHGRYEINDIDRSIYFTCGEVLELFSDNQWTIGRMEYSQDKEDYYFITNDGEYIFDLTGKMARNI